MKEDITSLLDKISSINEKYEEIFRISGEKFNIFETLKLTNDEWVHSRILATLLDPEGFHGKGNLFLEKFLEIIAEKYETCAETDKDGENKVGRKFGIEDVKIQEEKSINNGRPDITMTNRNGKIILENKIWAEEQDKQLERYSEEKPIHLIYLTPFGIKAKIGKGNFNYIKMSYRDDILEWLKLCKKESADNPILRETLTQYILLIKQLTGQQRSEKMKEEVIAAIMDNSDKSDKYVSAAFDIADSIEDVKRYIVEKKFLDPLKTIAEDKGFGEFITDIHGKKSYFLRWKFDIWLFKEKWKYLAICLKFTDAGKGFMYGILSKERKELKYSRLNDKSKIVDELKKEAGKFEIEDEWGWFLLCRKEKTSLWKTYANTKEFFTEVISKKGMEKMKSEFIEVIKELSEIGDRLEDKLNEM